MNRKQLENCAFRESRQRRNEKNLSRWDFKERRGIDYTEKLAGENREIMVFDPSGTTDASMNTFRPLWSLFSDELEQACAGRNVTLRAPYFRWRKGYKGNVESD